MESHIDGVVVLATDFVQKDEKKDERVDRILDMINSKHDWNNRVWGVKEASNSEFEESGEEKGEDQTADTERGENSHVAGNVDGTADVSGRNKRKHADRGAESRKKNVLCHLAASSKGNIDTDMKNFLEDLVQASFTTFGEKFCQQFSDRLGKIETEVTQLRTASERTEQFETVAVQSLTIHKHLHITPYNVSYVPMSWLNRLKCHCGVYTIKHIECHVLGLDISMVSDENIWGARIKIMWDLWEAANDLELIERMSKYEPIKCSKPAEYVEIDDL
ncbi:hypothetical protein Bca52824_087414 [Brassica carinata]|uniref:Uncharacterized protein n=1 Tax=Brassica carinata TaxID=52824 RepID=A0A8X7TNL5_BRACI|nr:hypothetical protein Bca52824_087414 [Brassica carinata]